MAPPMSAPRSSFPLTILSLPAPQSYTHQTLDGTNEPCTVFFAAAAVKSPMLPTMKYEKVLLFASGFLLIYFPQSGILVVGLESSSRKGLSHFGVCSCSPATFWTTSALPRRWVEMVKAQRGERRCRGHVRRKVPAREVSGAIATRVRDRRGDDKVVR